MRKNQYIGIILDFVFFIFYFYFFVAILQYLNKKDFKMFNLIILISQLLIFGFKKSQSNKMSLLKTLSVNTYPSKNFYLFFIIDWFLPA